MIKMVGLTLFISIKAMALVPVEGILMGAAKDELQQDPLSHIFSDIYDRSQVGENKKAKLYYNTYLGGAHLAESCSIYAPSNYSTTWREKQAKRSVVATLQYLGLDTTIKAIGAYASSLEIGKTEYERLTQNLLKNYCSKNLTVYSLKKIESSLMHYYSRPQEDLIPKISTSPFATEIFKAQGEVDHAKSNGLDYAVKGFRAFCSWGGDLEDYRMLVPYLKNRFIMSFVNKNIAGKQDIYDENLGKVVLASSDDTVRVACEELICRKVPMYEFKRKFPLSAGSTGLETDLAKLYCHHFSMLEYGPNTIGQVKQWIRSTELEDPIFETNFFISLMTGVPDPMLGLENYSELPLVLKSSVDERWNRWARDSLAFFSGDLLYEESIKVRAIPQRDRGLLTVRGFLLDFHVTLGEMDRVVDANDKLGLQFNLKLSKNFLRSMKDKWSLMTRELDEEAQKKFLEETATYIEHQLKHKEKLFPQKMWTDDFAKIITEELLAQVLIYRGSGFDSYQDEVLKIPVKFSYGVFALGYLRYRASINADRLKLNL